MRHHLFAVYILNLVAIVVFTATNSAAANPSDPVAVQRFGDEIVRIETMWNLSVEFRPQQRISGMLFLPTDSETDLLVLSGSGEHAAPVVFASEESHALDVTIDRLPNTSRVSTVYGPIEAGASLSGNSIRVRWFGDDEANGYYLIEADGVRIVYALTPFDELIEPVDVLLAPWSAVANIAPLTARYFVPMDDQSGEPVKGREAVGNTLAVSAAAGPRSSGEAVVVNLKSAPWTMPDELEQLFEEKEQLADEAEAVFDPLSVHQMNHKPANGTHTPRWNVEHMMGRELLFFSSIYVARDPELRAIDLNPKQMPPDYVAKHPDWTGREEARQIERVQSFTRRFAYLLDGLPLDELPQGAPKFARSLEGLFAIMGRHYPEHTVNVKEKMQLPDWPDHE
jgi:DinB family protein